ncbi:MAG: CaiB/BaiF CoA-transferase family protein [Steroidobacteraceae bacterium]
MAGPLSHVRVLDLSRIMAGPWSTQILADLGADVIKVERPGVGDDTRSWGPPYLKDSGGSDTKEAGYYLAVNRGKRSITVSLDKPEGQNIIRQLAARSDILLENYKVGTLARFGLDYESLKVANPRLIYCSITGYGQTGPKRELAAYDFAIQGMGGLMSVTGERDDRPGGGPQKVGIPIVDLTTGMYATVAVLAALASRHETGRGDYIDVGMLDVQAAMLCNQAMNYFTGGQVPRRHGNAHPNIQPQDVYACRDGAMVLACGNDRQFQEISHIIGRPELAQDPRYSTNSARVRNLGTLAPILQECFGHEDRAYWVAALEAAGVPCGPINTVAEVFEDPQVRFRQMRIKLSHPLAVNIPLVGSPMVFTEEPLTLERAPPLLGQHTDEILQELGLDATAIAQLRRDQVI